MPGRAPYDVVRCPAGVVRTPYGARPILYEFSRSMMNTFISKLAIIPPKKQVVKIRKIEANADSDGDENHTCPRLQKNSIALVRCMFIILSCLIEIYIFLYYVFGLEVKYLCKYNMFFCKNTSLLTGGCSTHETSSGARTGIVRCPDRHRPIC